MTYVKDLVQGICAAIEKPFLNSIINAVSYPQTSIQQIIESSQQLVEVASSIFPISAAQLEEQDVRQWVDLPLWLHSDDFTYDNTRFTVDLGVVPTPVSQALENTITYFEQINWPQPKYGMEKARYDALVRHMANA